MLTQEQLELYLTKCLSTGADFAEIFLEESCDKTIHFIDQKIERVNSYLIKGIGIRICLKNQVIYGHTDKLNEVNSLIDKLINNFHSDVNQTKVLLSKKKIYHDAIKIPHAQYSACEKKELLSKIDQLARLESEKVTQVEITLKETDQKVTIANSLGHYTEDNRTLTRLSTTIFVKDNTQLEKSSVAPGFKKGYEFLTEIDIDEMVKEVVARALEKLTAKACPGGEMPVIIGNGFGGVIFHEACVHALEATTVAKGSSVFNDCLGKIIASPKVTIIDDATIKNEWGSFNIDDEGNRSRKNILIQNGVLTNYLIDYINGKIMSQPTTSSSRRESYQYAPTSRMSNTYLAPGTDTIEEMIASIDYGIYATSMGGGSVNPKTGDFNFAVNNAYLIENGQITSPLKGVSLIGNGREIIKRVSMVSDDLKLATGMCGSESGYVPVTVGQPTIKVDKILVGGGASRENR